MAIKRKRQWLTLREATSLAEPVVYGLGDHDGIFYVGQTSAASSRFHTHRTASNSNALLNRRLRALGEKVRVYILHRSPPNLLVAECLEISTRRGLLNVNGMTELPLLQPPEPWSDMGRYPSRWADKFTGLDIEEDFQAVISRMSPARRCAYEIELYQELPPTIRRRFDGWLRRRRDPMMQWLEASDGS